MKVVGLITEYNPFHNGHKYHIEKAKKITGADYVVVAMSSNFVQRGTPAIIDKYTRTEMALKAGTDMVFELPIHFACVSAEYFAFGAVSLLNQLGFIDCICFGSEAGDITLLEPITEILLNEPEEYKKILNQYLKKGLSFPAARSNALRDYLTNVNDYHSNSSFHTLSKVELEQLLLSSNNILGIEYLKALKQLNSHMTPYTIKREGSAYSDNTLNTDHTEFSSATAIRGILEANMDLSSLANAVPQEIFSILENGYQKSYPISENDFSDMLYYKLKSTPLELLSSYGDVSEELAYRIKNQLSCYEDWKQFALVLKTKQVTLTRINRCLLHILLELPKPNKDLFFIRLLGFRKSASHLLKQVPEDSIPVITKPAHGNTLLTGTAKEMFEHEMFCNDLYYQIVYSKFKTKIASDYQHPLVIL